MKWSPEFLLWVDLGDVIGDKRWSYPPLGTKFMLWATGPSGPAPVAWSLMGFRWSDGSSGSKRVGSTVIPDMLVVLLIGGRGRFPSNIFFLYYGQNTERERERERERNREWEDWGSEKWEWKVGVKINGMRGGWERIWAVACRHQVQEVHITLLLPF
jgi:hypothetical protein